jgi:hypothetical protein
MLPKMFHFIYNQPEHRLGYHLRSKGYPNTSNERFNTRLIKKRFIKKGFIKKSNNPIKQAPIPEPKIDNTHSKTVDVSLTRGKCGSETLNATFKINSNNPIKQTPEPEPESEPKIDNKHSNTFDVICLTGGKCGSTTLNATFKKNGYNSTKIHNIYDYKLQFGDDNLIKFINNSASNKTLYLIDSYRTPIERKISSFFQNINKHIPDYKNKTCEELIDTFNTSYLNHIEEYHSINPIMREYGLEPFDTFDFKKKYVLIEKGNLVFIKILFSDINEWSDILSEIFNKKIILEPSNISFKKDYFSIYSEFKSKYTTTKYYLEHILKYDREFTIFNTPEQQQKYIEKWSNIAY